MPTTRVALGTIAMAALLVLAGCTGSVPGTGASNAGPGSDDPTADTDVRSPTNADVGTGAGAVEFYVSDQPNDVDDFEHLNVTVERVGLHQVGPTNGSERDGEWIEYGANATVDLTELRGANATELDVLAAPNGTYDRAFVYVGDVEATLADGGETRVKLPSGKLQVKKGFTVGDGERVRFVFDITVTKAGKSGKYILQPVVAESGTDVPIDDVDDRDDEEDDREDLNATFDGTVTPGGNATVAVTRQGEPVASATVAVEGEAVGTTDDAGRFTYPVPDDAEEFEVEVTEGDAEAELKREFQDEAE